MLTIALIVVAYVTLIFAPATARAAAAPENVKVSYAVLSMAYMDHVLAMDKGYFRFRLPRSLKTVSQWRKSAVLSSCRMTIATQSPLGED